jgi:hypothetical protein
MYIQPIPTGMVLTEWLSALRKGDLYELVSGATTVALIRSQGDRLP